MLEWLHHLETGLSRVAAIATFLLEGLSVGCVLLGLYKTLKLAIILNRGRHPYLFPFNQVRLRFGVWLALALEFQLGADIVSTTVAPTLDALTKLALIAIIRTFLNYFLSRELSAELTLEKQRATLSQEPQFSEES